ncbi:MAG: hypothetical protein ACJAWZ_003899 [Paracoccaceae bacterium]|jgi:hypothetical protein
MRKTASPSAFRSKGVASDVPLPAALPVMLASLGASGLAVRRREPA